MRLLRNLVDFDRVETTGEILHFRIAELVVIGWAISHAWAWGLYLPRLDSVVLAPGLAEYVDVTFMFGRGVGLVNASLITLLLLTGLFRFWRYGYLVALLPFHLQYAARYSQGKISHGSNIIGMTILCMAIATVAFPRQQERRRASLGLWYFFIGIGYTSAALSKLVATGPTWPAGRHLRMWIHERSVDIFSLTGVVDLNWLQRLALDVDLMATSILTFGLLIEGLAWAMWFPRYRSWIMTLLVVMHVGILTVMNVTFAANIVLLFLFAYAWSAPIDGALRRWDAAGGATIARWSRRWA